MQPGVHAPPKSQCSAFSRMMAARRVSSVHGGTVGNLDRIASYSSCPPLPVIRQPQDTAVSLSDAYPALHTGLKQDECDVAISKPSRKAWPTATYVITDKTPRAELLSIIMQLQEDLTQRTDSVNAIQRNFERLSAMHQAEQHELQSLRLLEKKGRKVEPNIHETEIQELKSVLGEMQQKALVEHTSFAQMEENLQTAQRSCVLQQNIARLVSSHADGTRDVLQAEAVAHFELCMCALSERAAISASEVAIQQQLLYEDAAQLVTDHQARIFSELVRVGAPVNLRVQESSAKVSTATLLEPVRQGLCETAEAVHEYVDATRATEEERVRAMGQCERDCEELRRALHELLPLRLQETEEAETISRSALLFGALIACTATQQAFEHICSRTANFEAATATSRSAWEVTSTLLTRRVSDWCNTAELRLVDFCKTMEASMTETARECDDQWQQAAQELLLEERKQLQNLHALQLQALQADWREQRDSAERTHARELEQVRGAYVAQIQIAEDRRVAAEKQISVIEAALMERKGDHDTEVRAVEARWRSALTEGVRNCEKNWRAILDSYQERQNGFSAALVRLLGDVLGTRIQRLYEEQAERTALCSSHWRNHSQHLQDAHSAAIQHAVAHAAVFERMRFHAQDEAANRASLYASEATHWAILANTEVAHKAEVYHARCMDAAAAKLERLRADTAEREVRWQERLDALESDLREAQQQCLAAVNRASDAVLAAQETQAELQATRRDFAAYKSGVSAAAERIQVAESATESACCCPLCLELYYQPIACVPCGHMYCASCLLRHARNRSLSGVTSSFSSAVATSPSESGPVRSTGDLEVTQWLRRKSTSNTFLFCPECASTTVSTVVELPTLGELTAKYDYKKRSLAVLLAELQ